MTFAEAAVAFFKTTNGPTLWKKYASKTLVQEVVDGMANVNTLPTIVAASLAFDRLVKNGDIERTDGKTAEDDRAHDAVVARNGLEAALIAGALPPLTTDEIEYFASLSQFELSKLYWGPDNDALTGFAVRYRKAMAEHGFREPAHYAAGGLR
jgi:hypothetical protein